MRINIVCAWYEVGMRHYSFSVLKNIKDHLPAGYQIKVILVLRNDVSNYPELVELNGMDIEHIIIKNPLLNILSKAFPFFFDELILRKVKKDNADLLYILFGGLFFKNVRRIKSKVDILYTIHDLNPHEKNKTSWRDRWLSETENKRDHNLVVNSDYLITNSATQFIQLQDIYGVNKVFYAEMPSLVNSRIATGSMNIPELIEEKDYILFFGRIDRYKGLDKLVKSHLESGIETTLVIAGSGKLWFDIPVSDKIILINRYIHDEELNFLFKNAKMSVMPYLSITQTSLISIPFYFRCPVIFSKINEFIMLCKESGSITCDFGSSVDYHQCVEELSIPNRAADVAALQVQYYDRVYNADKFSQTMLSVFQSIKSDEVK